MSLSSNAVGTARAADPPVRPLRAGIVGLGRMATAIESENTQGMVSHAGAYARSPEFVLVAGCDPDPEQQRRFRDSWGNRPTYGSAAEMVEAERLDVVSVCSPTGYHFENVRELLRADVKAIFCEKPLCANLRQADEVVQACERAGVLLAVNHTRRWSPVYQEVRELLDQGRIGRVTSVVALYGGGVANIGTHMIDVLRYLVGDITCVRSLTDASLAGDPDLSAHLEFENGASGFLVAHDAREYLLFEADLIGTEGRIAVTGNGATVFLSTLSPAAGTYRTLAAPPEQLHPPAGRPLVNAIEAMARVLRGGAEKTALCTGADGRSALEAVAALRLSTQRGSESVSLPLDERDPLIPSRSRGLDPE